MKGRLALSLFALPFAGVGVWMLWSIGNLLADAQAMRDWEPVEAIVEAGGTTVNHGDDSTTYTAWGRYRYEYRGRQYSSDRVAIGSGGDNLGDFQQDLGRRLERAAASGQPVTAWVDPADPAAAVIDRRLRWGLLGFKSIFLLVFGSAGAGMLYFAWRKAPPKPDPAAVGDQPWLARAEWQTETLTSGSKTAMRFAWGFATFWCLVSAPTPFLAWREVVDNQNYAGLLALLFPLIGIGLVAWAIRRTREWRRFGPVPLALDPFPGAIGGHVGGTLELALPYDPAQRFSVTLMALKSYISGSGKNRSRRESAEWQDSRLAHAEPGGRGTRLAFRFDVPDGLPAADAARDEDSYFLWRLNVSADLPGADLDRDYDIPVYRTAARSSRIPERVLEQADGLQADFDEQNLRRRFRYEVGASGKRLLFPIGRNLGSGLGGAVIGLAFAGAGAFIISEGSTIFGSIFGGVGALIALACVYMIGNSLEVRQDGADIVTQRRLFGIPIKTGRFARHDVRRLEQDKGTKTQSGGKHVVHYTIRAVRADGHSFVLGESFQGNSEARAAMQFLAREFSLPLPEDDEPTAADNPLAAD